MIITDIEMTFNTDDTTLTISGPDKTDSYIHLAGFKANEIYLATSYIIDGETHKQEAHIISPLLLVEHMRELIKKEQQARFTVTYPLDKNDHYIITIETAPCGVIQIYTMTCDAIENYLD